MNRIDDSIVVSVVHAVVVDVVVVVLSYVLSFEIAVPASRRSEVAELLRFVSSASTTAT
jgi:hypothetical protein